MSASQLENQVYVIDSDLALEYQIPAFEVEPDFCLIEYYLDIPNDKISPKSHFDNESMLFTFEMELSDLELAGMT